MRWKALGRVVLASGRLAFPKAPNHPGIYRLRLIGCKGSRCYVGETDSLRRRFQSYRTPGPTQQTSIRINQVLRARIVSGDQVVLDVADELRLMIDGRRRDVDLSDKAVRRLFEHAALVAVNGTNVEDLNK